MVDCANPGEDQGRHTICLLYRSTVVIYVKYFSFLHICHVDWVHLTVENNHTFSVLHWRSLPSLTVGFVHALVFVRNIARMYQSRAYGNHSLDHRAEVFIIKLKGDAESDAALKGRTERNKISWVTIKSRRVIVTLPTASVFCYLEADLKQGPKNWMAAHCKLQYSLQLVMVLDAPSQGENPLGLLFYNLGILRHVAAQF